MKKWISVTLGLSAGLITASSTTTAIYFIANSNRERKIKNEINDNINEIVKAKEYNWKGFRLYFKKKNDDGSDKLTKGDVRQWFEAGVTIINSWYLYSERSGIYSFNKTYRDKNKFNPYGKLTDIQNPKVTFERNNRNGTNPFLYKYNDTTYNNATKITKDSSFNYISDSVNADGNVFFRRLSLTSLFYESIWSQKLYPKIKKTMKVGNRASYLRRCLMTYGVFAILAIIKNIPVFGPLVEKIGKKIIKILSKKPLRVMFLTIGLATGNIFKHIALMIIKYIIPSNYQAFANEYHYKTSQWNSNEFSEKQKESEAILDNANSLIKSLIDDYKSDGVEDYDEGDSSDGDGDGGGSDDSLDEIKPDEDSSDEDKVKFEAFMKIFKGALSVLENIVDSLIAKLLTPLFFRISNFIAPLVHGAIQPLVEYFNVEVFSKFYDWLSNIFITNGKINWLIRSTVKAIDDILKTVDDIKEALKKIWEKLKQIWDQIKNEIQNGIDKINKAVEAAIKFFEILYKLFTDPEQFKQDLIDWIIGWINQQAQDAIDKIKQAFEPLIKFKEWIEQTVGKVKDFYDKYIKPIVDIIGGILYSEIASSINLNTNIELNTILRRYKNVR